MKWYKRLPKKATILFCAAVMAVTPVFPAASIQAANDSLWTNTEEISFETEGEAVTETHHRYGLPCHTADIPYTFLKRNGGSEDRTSENDCVFDTSYGSVNRNGSLYTPTEASQGGRIRSSSWRTLPIPHETHLFRAIPTNDVYPTRFIRAYTLDNVHVKHQNMAINSVRYSYHLAGLSDAFAGEVQWNDGQGVRLFSNQIGVSSNGQWMLGRDDQGRIVRINTNTLEVATVFQTSGGWPSPVGNYDMAISNDGQHGVVSGRTLNSSSINTTWIIDFTTCDFSVMNTKDLIDGCEVRNISPELEGITGDRQKAEFPVFSSDNTVISVNLTLNNEEKRVALIAPDHEYSSLDYLALGDSFASGEGDVASYYKSGTNVPISDKLLRGEKCRISSRSYPYLLSQQMGIPDERFESVACSGAETRDINANREGYLGQRDRLRGVSPDERRAMQDTALQGFIPGRVPQIEFVEKYKPKVATLSIGGNDAGFSDILGTCALPAGLPPGSTCDHAGLDTAKRAELAHIIEQELSKKLENLYKEIHRASPKTAIYVLGYSKILKNPETCNELAFNARERTFIDESFTYMNSVIEAAAKRAGVYYLDVENALGDAVLCGEEEPRAANGLRFGNDVDPLLPNARFIDAGSYHPNHYGHQRVANRIQQLAPNLLEHSFACPPYAAICPQPSPTPTAPPYFDIEGRRSDRPLHKRILDRYRYSFEESAEIIQHNIFKPLSDIRIELWSDPVLLGEFTADENGSLETTITLPDNVPAGYHTLRVQATLLSGEEVEFYQTVLLLGHEGDIDNNGIPDVDQECIEAPVAVTTDIDGAIVYPCGADIENDTPDDPSDPAPQPDPVETIHHALQDL